MANSNTTNTDHLPVPQQQFFQKLTRLLRSGTLIRRKIKGFDPKNLYDKAAVFNNLGYYGGSAFRRETSPFSILGAYSLLDRINRLAEYSEMIRNSSDCDTACDIYASEACSKDEHGNILHIQSDNAQIQKHLEEYFYDVLNINYDGPRLFRNLVQNGDVFYYHEVMPGQGIIHIEPIPSHTILREEKYDPDDPFAIRFKLIEHGGKYLENWQVSHIRLMGGEEYLPYGRSILEPARRPFRQLLLIEDAMLLYRIVRSPGRKVFYIDITSVPPAEVNNYVEQVTQAFRANQIVDKSTGRIDERHAPVSQLDDLFIPVKPNSLTKVEPLPSDQNSTIIEDVEFIHKRLTAALKVPRPYLGYDDILSTKGGLAQEDTRFAKLVENIQQMVIPEFNKMAMIHLYALGFDGDDLINFTLKLSRPSSLVVQQKLNIWSQKIKVMDDAKNTELFDSEFILKNFGELSDDQITQIRIGQERDKMFAKRLEAKEPPKHEEIEDDAVIDALDISNYQTYKPEPGKSDKPNAKAPRKPLVAPEKENDIKRLPQSFGTPIKPNLTTILGKSLVADSIGFGEDDSFYSDLETILESNELRDRQKHGVPRGINAYMRSTLQRLQEHIKNETKEVEVILEDVEDDNEISVLYQLGLQ